MSAPGSAKFSWSVSTPEGTTASGECDFLVVPTAGGELGVLAEHAAIVAAVVSGDVRVTTDGKTSLVTVAGGVVEVRDNAARVMVTSATAAGPETAAASTE